jgi:hypothetical protein
MRRLSHAANIYTGHIMVGLHSMPCGPKSSSVQAPLPRNTQLTFLSDARNGVLATLVQQGLLVANTNRTGMFR